MLIPSARVDRLVVLEAVAIEVIGLVIFRLEIQKGRVMDMELKPKGYLALLKVAYLADWLANAHAESPSGEDKEIVRMCRRIYSQAETFGFGDLVPFEPAREDYIPSREFVEEIESAFIADHVDRVFWRELAARLTDRVMDEKFGAEMDGWSDEHYRKRREPIEKKVENELRENGMKNLFLLGEF